MQEHQTKRRRSGRGFANANLELSESARTTVYEAIHAFNGRTDFASTYLTAEYHSKYCDESVVPGPVRRDAAIRKFLECEERNAITNLVLERIDPGFNILPRVSFVSFLRFARRLIRDILGPLSDEVVLGEFSGGASTSRPRTRSHPALKFTGEVDITEEAWPFVDLIHRQAPLLRQHGAFTSFREVRGSVLFTVPKKTDIDRCACKEPDVNMFLQKGVGRHIRRRLLRYNINLNDQRINRGLAQDGSRYDNLATLDLSSASDTISQAAVSMLLPPIWFEYLNSIRSKDVEIDGELHRLEMFSSMGNGFTFELETLIFFALMRTVAYFEGVPGVVSIYGDDIVIPSGIGDLASFVLGTFGFRVNEDKSFISGPFRESCGGHYYNGFDVTPFYLKRAATHMTDVIRVANQLRRWAFADPSRQYEVPEAFQQWRVLADLVPKVLWGGYDYSVDTKLVSPPVNDSRVLQRITVDRKLDETGRYLHWHSSNWNRTSNPDREAAEDQETQPKQCRLRRAKPGAPVCSHWFFQELVA